ncbi:MAG: hypothetical protein D6705_16515 [Deltaproteobacteria bacterium]|nr:MAG: hypothetical protein D6705_16515 [Deltaproteobacteria bacterium]
MASFDVQTSLLRRRVASAAAGLLVLVLGPAACKDGDGSLNEEDAPGRTAQVMCDIYFECACADHQDPDRFTSREHCEAEWEASVQMDLDEAEANGLVYDGECAASTLSRLESLGCETDPLEVFADLAEQSPCKVFYGERQAGQSCTTYADLGSDDCAQGLQCNGNGVCEAFETIPGPGDPCETEFTTFCAGDAVCIDLGEGPHCEPWPRAGETCLGQPDLCAPGLSCDQNTKTCGPAPGEGEACAPDILPQNQCAEGLGCEAGTCQPLPGGGEPCIASCADGFTCEGGTCVEATPYTCNVAWSA